MKNLETGQIWGIKSDNKNFKIEILKIEILNYTKIIHIAILDNNNEYVIEHLPFSENAILNSITQLQSERKNSTVQHNKGYNYWKEEFLLGNAGIYGIDVNQVLTL